MVVAGGIFFEAIGATSFAAIAAIESFSCSFTPHVNLSATLFRRFPMSRKTQAKLLILLLTYELALNG